MPNESRTPLGTDALTEKKHQLLSTREDNELWTLIIKPMLENRKKAAFDTMVDKANSRTPDVRETHRIIYNVFESMEADLKQMEDFFKPKPEEVE